MTGSSICGKTQLRAQTVDRYTQKWLFRRAIPLTSLAGWFLFSLPPRAFRFNAFSRYGISLGSGESPNMKKPLFRWSAPVAILAGSVLVGCGTGIGTEPVRPLTSDSFVQRPRPNAPTGGPLDRPSPLLYDQVHVGLGQPHDPSSDEAGSGEISKTVRESIRPPALPRRRRLESARRHQLLLQLIRWQG